MDSEIVDSTYLRKLRMENEDLHKKISSFKKVKEELKQELADKEEEMKKEKLKLRNKFIEEKKKAFIDYCQRKEINLFEQISVLEKKTTELKKENSELIIRRDELEQMTLNLMDANETLEKRTASLCARITELDKENLGHASTIKELEHNRTQLEEYLSQTIEACEDKKSEATQMKRMLQIEKTKYAEKTQKDASKIADLERMLATLNDQNDRILEEKDTLHQLHELQKDKSASTAKELEDLKLSLDRKQRDVSVIALPLDWEEMPDNVNCKVFPATQEAYDMVTGRFMDTIQNLQVKIIKIDRIQNKCLYKQYLLKKTQISQHSKSSNEKLLWHGTYGEAVSGITVNGFDRGYKGYSTGTLYGDGVYFSTSSKYSTGYSKQDIHKERRMFLARVLTGDITTGKAGYRVLPIKDPTTFTRYDSLVDKESNPTIFVVMNDTQAYPEYLVTYEVTGQ